MTPERRAELYRATDRAKAALIPGDRLFVSRCGGIRTTVTFTGWDDLWICSKTLDDIAASSVIKVNGVPTSFMDQESVEEPPCTDCGGTGIAYQTERRCACTLTDEERQSWQDIRDGMNR